ncbi:MAG: hypothetical protein BZ133_08555 [Methanosphaera sp. SHI613]|nr:MAG: hypothetical protein BZ133_08555 [Methanosphaera sp. SHI613]
MKVSLNNILFILLGSLLMALPASYEPNHFAKALFLGAFIQSLAYTLIVNWIGIRFSWVIKICFVIIFILFSLETYTYYFFNSRLNPGIVTLILQTSWKEIQEFIQIYLFNFSAIAIFIVDIVLFILLWKIIFARYQYINISYRLIINSVVVIIVFLGVFIDTIPLPFPVGQNTINELFLSIRFVHTKHGELNKMEKMFGKIQIIHSPKVNKAPVVVLIIGESYNKHHSSLYGYKIITSPLLNVERENGRLVVFSHAYTPTNGTNFAMRYIFSMKSCHKIDSCRDYILMPAVFKKAGYRVGYYDNQYTRSSGGALDYSCGYFLNPKTINGQCFDYRNTKTESYDGDFVIAEKKHLLIANKSLNIIHLMGQHFDAAKRYPIEFSRIKASDIKRPDLDESERQKVAEYDNATLYNDYVVSMIINIFREKDAVIVYLSDHGEQIYDGNHHFFGRTFGSTKDVETLSNVYEVPFLIWYSDLFEERHKELVTSIRQASDKSICIDDIAYLLFELASIDFNYHQSNRSYIHSGYIPHIVIYE